ncbi:MAG: response regulator, partial [Gammaproteobacteria bacterium]|nr:response regulator [Gammaproteobacteria bacterium]
MRKILLVDDDRLILATLGEGLRQAGFEVTEADSGERAIALCQEVEPDLAILDMRMPGMSGIQVAHWLRMESHIP